MKLKMLVIMAVLCLVTSVPGFMLDTVEYTKEAEALKALGLFNGTNNGFELDRAPTRVEAAAMLVKLLGAENEAKSKHYKHPFTDVPSWATDFVGYLYEYKMTTGIGNNQFGSSNLISSKDFTVFVLKSLGYTSDFAYADTMNFAVSKKLITGGEMDQLTRYNFKRDEMVLLAFNALKTNVKGQTTTLLDQFVNNGLITTQSAAATGLSKHVFVEYNNVDMSSGELVLQNKLTWSTLKLMTLNNGEMGYYSALYINKNVAEWKGVQDVKLEIKFYNDGKLVYRKEKINFSYGLSTHGFDLKLKPFEFDRVTIEGQPYEYANIPDAYDDKIVFITESQMALMIPDIEKYRGATFGAYQLFVGTDSKNTRNINLMKDMIYFDMKNSEEYPTTNYYASPNGDLKEHPDAKISVKFNTEPLSMKHYDNIQNVYELTVPSLQANNYLVAYFFDENDVLVKAYVIYE